MPPSSRSALLLLLLLAPAAGAQDPAPPAVSDTPVVPDRRPVPVPGERARAVPPPARVSGGPEQGADLQDDILRLRSPYSAASFLDNPDIRQGFRDPELAQRLFLASTEIRDVFNIVTGVGDAGVVRSAIVARAASCFCQKPALMMSWYASQVEPIYGKERKRMLEDALLEWDRLPSAVQRALQARRSAWPRLDLDERFAALKADYTDREKAAILATVPRSDSELRALRRRFEALEPLLVDDASREISHHMRKASALVSGLNDAQARMGRSTPPELRAALAAARSAGTVEEALAGLDRVFDGLGVRNAQVDRQRPSNASEALTPDQRSVLETTLRHSLLRSIAGTTAGDELNAFYRDTPMNIRIVAGSPSTLGWYDGGDDIMLNQRLIEEFVRTQGRTAMDLTTDPALLQRMTWLLAPLFVHEATHHRQDSWARGQDIPAPAMQQKEREAHVTDTLFFMEMGQRNPEFLAFMRASAPTSMLADESVRKADRMHRHGLATFRQGIDAFHYADLLSLEGHAWCAHRWHRNAVADLDAELQRRRDLPAPQQAELQRGPETPPQIASEEDWRAVLARSGTPHLQAMLERRRERLTLATPRVYDAWRSRFAEYDARSQRQFDTIQGGGPPERVLVPPPPVQRR